MEEISKAAELDLLPEMRKVAPEAGFTWQELASYPGLNTPAASEIVVFAKSLARVGGTMKVPFGTEGGLIQGAGIPVVVCGPGSIDQAHKPNEFVALSQLAACECFMDRLLMRLST